MRKETYGILQIKNGRIFLVATFCLSFDRAKEKYQEEEKGEKDEWN